MTGRADNPPMPLRACFALPGLHRVNRGAEVVLEEVARRAHRHDVDLTLIGSGQPRPDQPYTFIHAPCIPREKFERFPKIPYARDHYAWEELSFAPALLRQFKPHHFDVTLTCGYPWSNWLLRRGRRKTAAGHKSPAHVFVTQNGDWMVRSRSAEFKHFACDALICTNPEIYDRHKDTHHAALIPNGVDVDRFHPPASDNDRAARAATRADLGVSDNAAPLVLVVAALIGSKRVPDAVRCASAIPGAYLIVAGDGEQRAEVDALGRSLLPGRFRRLTVPRDRMPDLYRAADALLHMSTDEPFGNIYIEALATGLPVVAHDTPVTRWFTAGHAHLADTTDPLAATAALARALSDNSPAAATTRAASARDRFSWDSIASQYCAFLHDTHRRNFRTSN